MDPKIIAFPISDPSEDRQLFKPILEKTPLHGPVNHPWFPKS
jgi:hypothetical protein